MLSLIPHPIQSEGAHDPNRIEAEVSRLAHGLRIRFDLRAISAKMSEPPSKAKFPSPGPRKNDLWKNTCFEAFLGAPGQNNYYELNANASGAWNIYYFDGYRKPQPPREFAEAKISQIQCDPNSFELEMNWPQIPDKLELSLCAVILFSSGAFYFSSAHKGAKPDFHLRESFTLRSDI